MEMFENLSIIGLIQKGGVTVIVLLLLSVFSVAVMFERAWAFRSFRSKTDAFSAGLIKALREKGAETAAALCRADKGPLANIFLSGYAKSSFGREDVVAAIEVAGKKEISLLLKRLGILGTIGSIAPFIGLFGTVVGIIRAFQDLALSTGAGPAAVADGIAEALVATAAGLFVAVPAVAAYNYFVRSASARSLDIEGAALELIPYISGRKDGA